MTLRGYMLAGAAALMVTGIGIDPASAQVPKLVIDLKAIAQAKLQVEQLRQHLAQLQQTYSAIAHLPQNELRQLAQQFNNSEFRNPLGSSGTTIGGYTNGGSLTADAQAYRNRNRVYSPDGKDFAAQELGRNANGIANTQAMAARLYQSAASHIQALQTLEGQLATAPDTKTVADIQARISMEQASFQGQQVQAQSLAMLAQSEERNRDQRTDEVRRQQIDNLIEQAKAHGG